MNANGLRVPLGEHLKKAERDALTTEQRRELDKPSKRILNRGLTDFVIEAARALHVDEFRAEDLRRAVQERYPSADAGAIGNSLAIAVNQGRGIERVGFGKTGVYRVSGTAPNLDDEAAFDRALAALADLEAVIRRHRETVALVRQLRKALGGI
jgi:hypothetical protein